MALIKSLELGRSGVFAEYWRITNVDVDFLSNTTRLVLSGYKDLQARIDGKCPVMTKLFVWRGSSNPITRDALLDGTIFTKVYDKLKEPNENMFEPANPLEGAVEA